jgi:hypothetical protein
LDGYDLKPFIFPTTDYILSKVFDAYTKKSGTKLESYYIFQDKQDNKKSYKLSVDYNYKVPKMVIEEYYDTILVKRHEYW